MISSSKSYDKLRESRRQSCESLSLAPRSCLARKAACIVGVNTQVEAVIPLPTSILHLTFIFRYSEASIDSTRSPFRFH